MPELPEVETVRRGLNQTTLNQSILGGDVPLARSIAHPVSPELFLEALTGCTITEWHRRGKYLLGSLSTASTSPEGPSDAGWLGVHLRMSGQLLWTMQDAPLETHCRVRLWFPEGRELRFVDQRTFGKMWWVPPAVPPEHIMTGLAKLGPEPFSSEFNPDYMAGWLRDRQRPIKSALLDQELVAGIGNIYADEALFLSGIHPKTLCATLTLTQIKTLYAAVLSVLQAGIDAGGTTISNFRNVEGVNGYYAGVAWVYRRTGDPCRKCETLIERIKLAGRSSHFCPTCQS